MTITRVQMIVRFGGKACIGPNGISTARWGAMVAQAIRQGG